MQIKDFEIEFYQGWFRIIVLVEADIAGRLVTLRIPMPLNADLDEQRARIKVIVQKFTEFETEKLVPLRNRFKGAEL